MERKGVRHPKTGDLMTADELAAYNLEVYNQALANGKLYNVGPLGESGTDFSPERWDSYFKKNENLKPTNYIPQKEAQAKFDAGETIDTSSQEFVVKDRGTITEMDKEPSFPSRGNDNSFLTVEQAKQQSEISKDAQDEIDTQAVVEAEADTIDINDAPIGHWVDEFSAMSDEDFKAHEAAIGQLPEVAQKAYAAVAQTKGDIEFEDVLSKADAANQSKIDAITEQAPSKDEATAALNSKTEDLTNKFNTNINAAIRDLELKDELQGIDDFYEGTTEKKGMMTSNVTDLGEGPGEAKADALQRDQAGDVQISDMKDKERTITTTIMQDTGLDMNQANALMGKLKGLCG